MKVMTRSMRQRALTIEQGWDKRVFEKRNSIFELLLTGLKNAVSCSIHFTTNKRR
jgi:hypothetical protein